MRSFLLVPPTLAPFWAQVSVVGGSMSKKMRRGNGNHGPPGAVNQINSSSVADITGDPFGGSSGNATRTTTIIRA